MREKLLKWFLMISGVIQIGYWGISHLFFPQWYLNSIGLTELANNPGTTAVFLNEIGILTTGLGIATVLASFNPIRNFAIIIVMYFVAIGSIIVSFYHIIAGSMAKGEWATIIIISIQIVLISILYPWSKLKECTLRRSWGGML
jgi:hypothetical protein